MNYSIQRNRAKPDMNDKQNLAVISNLQEMGNKLKNDFINKNLKSVNDT